MGRWLGEAHACRIYGAIMAAPDGKDYSVPELSEQLNIPRASVRDAINKKGWQNWVRDSRGESDHDRTEVKPLEF